MKNVINYIWSSINQARRSWTTPSVKLPLPLLSVGNLQAGGSGKTPFTIELIQLLKEMGKKPGVLTRAYGSLLENKSGVCSPSFSSHPLSAFGDEALFIFEKTGVPVFCGKDRANSFIHWVNHLASNEKPDVLVLDDGFQQFHLVKDLEIICLTDLDWNEGYFREFQKALKPEYFLVFTKSFKEQIQNVTDYLMSPQWNAKVHFSNQFDRKYQKGVLFTALAHPEYLFQQLTQNNENLVLEKKFFKDHHAFTLSDLREVEQKGGEAFKIFTTEKDWVKIKAITKNPDYYEVITQKCEWSFGREELKNRLCALFQK